jgi:tetraacyldisaccharide 4'-kinase
MLSQNLPKAFVFVGKDRHKSSMLAARAGAQLILLDDGMQHRSLARDFEIVVMDAGDPFGHGYFLPRGFLREGMKALSRADLVILNHVYDRERFLATRKKIARYTTAPVVATKIEVEEVLDLSGNTMPPLHGKRVGIFCGIANPDYFEKTVLSLGAYVVASYPIADHVDYNPEALASFAVACQEQGADYLICTEKDRVKLVDALDLAIPVAWIRMKLVFVEGKPLWDQFIGQAKRDLNRQL